MKTVAILPVCELTNILICIIFLNFLKLSYNHLYSIAKNDKILSTCDKIENMGENI